MIPTLSRPMSNAAGALQEQIQSRVADLLSRLGTDAGAPARSEVAQDYNADSFEPAPADAASGDSGLTVDDPKLQQALDQIAQDPEGRKLLEAAKANGLNSITTNAGLNPDGGAGIQGKTYSGSEGSRIEIADASSQDLVRTLTHELGHAATPGNGSSQAEEQAIDAIGSRVQERVTGQPSGYQLALDSYSNLPADNGIAEDLRALGLDPFGALP